MSCLRVELLEENVATMKRGILDILKNMESSTNSTKNYLKEQNEKIEKIINHVKTIDKLYETVDKELAKLKEKIDKLGEAPEKSNEETPAGSSKTSTDPKPKAIPSAYKDLDEHLTKKIMNYLKSHKNKPNVRMLTKSCMKGYKAAEAVKVLRRLGFMLSTYPETNPSTCIVYGLGDKA